MFLSSARFFSEYHNLLIGAGIRTYTHYYVSGNLQRNLAPATYQVPSTKYLARYTYTATYSSDDLTLLLTPGQEGPKSM